MSSNERNIWISGAVLMALAVILGAFGAHALKSRVDASALTWWETGATYHRAHALGLLLLASLYPRLRVSVQRRITLAARLMTLGVLLFSGSLYMMTITQIRALGAITPIGGTLWIIAWSLCVSALISHKVSSDHLDLAG